MKTVDRSMKLVRRTLIAVAALSALAVAPALAQSSSGEQQAQKPVTPVVIKTFGGWDVRCYPVTVPAPCDAWEAIAFKKSKRLAVSVSVVYVPSQNQYLMQFIVPLDVDLQKGAKIMAGKFTSPVMSFHHCDRIGCFFGVGQAGPLVDAFKSEKLMKIHLTFYRSKSVDLSVPLKGFDEARAAMVELAKQKAGTPQKAPAAAPEAASNP